MFEHGGFRPLWPVIFFLPLFFVGAAYLLESVRHGRAWTALIRLPFGRHARLRPIVRSGRDDRHI